VEKIMSPQELHVVTGAFGYSGKYIAARLLARGHRVRTLTNSGTRGNSFGGKVGVHPLAFDRPQALTDSLRGASVLYNTYWVRFNHKAFSRNQMIARPTLLGPPAADTGANYYGMGITVGTLNGKQMLSHGGGQNGTSTLLLSLPQSGVVVAVMANRDGWSQLGELTNKIAELAAP